MKKNIYIILLITLFFASIQGVFAACKVSTEIQKCDSALKDFGIDESKGISPGASLKSVNGQEITDNEGKPIICLQNSKEARIFQLVLDKNLKETDKEMDEFLENLTNSKDVYFGKNAKYTYLDGLNHIWEQSKYFNEKLREACPQTLKDAGDCVKEVLESDYISNEQTKEYISGSNGNCYKLADIKTEIFRNVALNIMLLNQQRVAEDEKKLYDQELRTKYEKFVDLMMTNLSYIERIRKKWPSKTKHVRNGDPTLPIFPGR